MKFEVGQKVRIVATECELRHIGVLVDGVSGAIGKVVGETGIDGYYVETVLPDGRVVKWHFDANMLEPHTEPKPKAEVIYINHYKVVFNPPYTIVGWEAFGQKWEGRAKCHPTDTFDKWTGFLTAIGRLNRVK